MKKYFALLIALCLSFFLVSAMSEDELPSCTGSDYKNNMNRTWSYTYPDAADALAVTFHANTAFENTYDKLFVIDKNGKETMYTGTELGGATIYVPGNSFKLRMTTDSSVTKWGFQVTGVAPAQPGDATYTVKDGIITKASICPNADGSPVDLTVPTEINGEQIVGIGSSAFLKQSYLGNVTIPAQVASVGTTPFTGCSNLQSIRFEDGHPLTAVSNNMFSGLTNLTTVELPDGVTTIGNSAFSGCTNLRMDLPESLTSIGSQAFYNCDQLTDIHIPGGVTSIGTQAFDQCDNLQSVEFAEENRMTSLPNYIFRNCKKLTDIVLPQDLTTIGQYAFQNCTALTMADLPKGLQTIDSYAFDGCTNLNEAELSKHVKSIGDYAFRNCSKLPSPTFSEALEKIGNSAYYNCDSITRAELPSSLTSLGTYAFYDCDKLAYANLEQVSLETLPESTFQSCDKLEAVYLPAGLKTIGTSAFNGCASLQTIELPDTVETLNTNAFRGCKTLSVINNGEPGILVVPSNVKTVGDYAFYDCDALKEATIPETVTSLGTYALADCANLEKLTIEGNITSLPTGLVQNDPKLKEVNFSKTNITAIPDYMFQGCTALSDFPFWEGLKSIGKSAFKSCSALQNQPLPSTLETIGSEAFYGCTSLTEVTMPASVKSVGASAYASDTKLVKADLSAAANLKTLESSLFSGDSKLTDVTLPPQLEAINYGVFYNCTSLPAVDIPNTVKTIGDNAFYNCDKLTQMTLPDSVTSIGSACFYDCNTLQSVHLSDNLTVIPNNAFYNDTKLRDINWPSGLTAINYRAFYNCDSLTQLTGMPNTLTSIGTEAFYDCDGLTSAVLPDSVTSMGTSAFRSCDKLQSVHLPDNLATIPQQAFRDCAKLKDIEWPSHLTTIDYNAFYNCDSITELTLPDSLTTINYQAFYDNDSLTRITMQDNVTSLGYSAFNSCDNLQEATLSDRLSTIQHDTFNNCRNLRTVDWPADLTKIEYNAFRDCNKLQSANLPDKVTTIGDNAFLNCFEMTDVTIPKDVTSIGAGAFSNCNSLNNVKWDAVNCTSLGNFTTSTKFTLTLGKNVDEISPDVLDKLVKGGANDLVFEGENFLTLPSTAGSGFPRPLDDLEEGEYFADAHGALYQVHGDEATLVYVPDGLESYTIPATVSDRNLRVTGVKNNALYQAQSLKTLNIASPESFTWLDSFAFAYASNLESVNGKTTKAEAEALFTNENLQKGVQLFYKTKLTEDPVTGVTGELIYSGISEITDSDGNVISTRTPDPGWPETVLVTITQIGDSLRGIDENGNEYTRDKMARIQQDPSGRFLAYTGETITTRVVISNPSSAALTDGDVIRIYFQMEDGGSMQIASKPVTGNDTLTITKTRVGEDGKVQNVDISMPVKKTADGCFYMELERPENGETISFPVVNNYPSPTTPGGNTAVWAEYYNKDAAEATKEQTHAPIPKHHELNWTTRRDLYPAEKNRTTTAEPTVAMKNGLAVISQTSYSIKMQRQAKDDYEEINGIWRAKNADDAPVWKALEGKGRDNVKSAEFTDILTLPEGVRFHPTVLAGLQAGNITYQNSYSTSNNKRQYSENRYVSIPGFGNVFRLDIPNHTDYLVPSVKLLNDRQVQLTWEWKNTNPNYNTLNSADIKALNATLYILNDVLCLEEDEIPTKDTVYTIQNELDVVQHYCYSEDVRWQDEAEYHLKNFVADPTLVKAGTSAVRGEYAPYTITLGNNGLLPVTTATYDRIQDTIDGSNHMQYISAANIWRMFADPEFGKGLTLEINEACLYGGKGSEILAGTRKTVIDINKENAVTDQTNTSYDNESNLGTNYSGRVPRNDTADANVKYPRARFVFAWNDQDQLTVTLYDKNGEGAVQLETRTLSGPGDVQQFMDDWGFFVTRNTAYAVAWDLTKLSNFSIAPGATKTITIPTSFKDTFMRITADTEEYDNTSGNTSHNYAYAKLGNTNVLSHDASPTFSNDFNLTKGAAYAQSHVYEDEYTGRVTVPDVVRYTVNARHYGNARYGVMPLTDHMQGRQALLVPWEQNKDEAWAAVANEYTDGSGNRYFILNQPGIYDHVYTGNAWADHVRVVQHGSGFSDDFDTYLFWYLPDYGGNTLSQIQYLTKVEQYDHVDRGPIFSWFNETWLGDHVDNRLHDAVVGSGIYEVLPILTDWEKKIVSFVGDTGDGADYCNVTRAKQVIYRLKFENAHKHDFTLTGKQFYDVLPVITENFKWSKDNVKLDYRQFSTSTPDKWTIRQARGTQADHVKSQEICWDDDFSMTCTDTANGIGYIYVTVTFPDDILWDEYVNAYNDQTLWNTLHVQNREGNWGYDDVYHDLSDVVVARLQKGVYATGGMLNGNNVYSQSDGARTTYANDDTISRKVFYYITLVNEGNTNMYLNPLQDVLPRGFTLYKDGERKIAPYVVNTGYAAINSTTTDKTISYVGTASRLSVMSVENLTGNYDGCQRVTMNLMPVKPGMVPNNTISSTDTAYFQYNPNLKKYYLRPGQAVVIRLECFTNGYPETDDTATNVVTMPVVDYFRNGVQIGTSQSTSSDYTANPKMTKNDGDCDIIDSAQAENEGFNTSGQNDTTQWLRSDVELTRGLILPGMTKWVAYSVVKDPDGNTQNDIWTPSPYATGSLSTIIWGLSAQNDGDQSIMDYVISDDLPDPLKFSGEFTFRQYINSTEYRETGKPLFTIHRDTELDAEGKTKLLPTMTIVSDSGSTYRYTIGDPGVEMAVTAWPRETDDSGEDTGDEPAGEGAPRIRVSVVKKDDDLEVLSVRFLDERMCIPLGGKIEMSLSSENPEKRLVDRTLVNSSFVTPMKDEQIAAWHGAPSNGNIVNHATNLGSAEKSVRNQAQITIFFSTITTALKEIKEIAHPSNATTSQNTVNYITLESKESLFNYSLTVRNESIMSVENIVLIDNLPEIGDHSTFQTGDLRESAFRVELADTLNPHLYIVETEVQNGVNVELEDAKVKVPQSYYHLEFSTATEFDENDWKGTGNSTRWHPWGELPRGQIRSVRLVFNDPAAQFNPLFRPMHNLRLTFDATIAKTENADGTVTYDPDAQPGLIAWNSFGYHYRFAGDQFDLEAAPLKVGIKIPDYPHLSKELVNARGKQHITETAREFRYMLYSGEAVSLGSSPLDAQGIIDIIRAAKRSYVIASITVPANASASAEDISFNNREDAQTWNGSTYVTGPWIMTPNGRYTLLELPVEDEMYSPYTLGGNRGGSYTFTYDAQNAPLNLLSTNMHNDWSLQIQKEDQFHTMLGGAVFAVYTEVPGEAWTDYDQTNPAQENERLGLTGENGMALTESNWPAQTLSSGGKTYRIMCIEKAPASGILQLNELEGGSYLVTELISPNPAFYSIEEEGGKPRVYTVTRNQDNPRATVIQKITNQYIAEGDIDLPARKEINGWQLTPGDFTFKIEGYDIINRTVYSSADAACPPMPRETTASNGPASDDDTENKTVLFRGIHLTQDDIGKTYYYQISEVMPASPDPRIEYDLTNYIAELTPVDLGGGEISAEFSYSVFNERGERPTAPDGAVFTNRYTDSTAVDIPLEKILNSDKGWHRAETYTVRITPFDASAEDPNAALDTRTFTTVFGDRTNTGTFITEEAVHITYGQDSIGKTYYYTIAEVIPDSAYGYSPTTGLRRQLPNGTFLTYRAFTQMDEDTRVDYLPVMWKQNDIEYDLSEYTLKAEIGFNTDTQTMTPAVTLLKNGQAIDSASTVSFTNSYNPEVALAKLSVAKQLTGRVWLRPDRYGKPLDTYTYLLSPDDPENPMPLRNVTSLDRDDYVDLNKQVEAGRLSDEPRSVSFDIITLTREALANEEGGYDHQKDFYYTITEVAPTEDGHVGDEYIGDPEETKWNHVTWDATERKVRITLTQNEEDGTLSAEVAYLNPQTNEFASFDFENFTDIITNKTLDPLLFINEFKQEPTPFEIAVKKTVEGLKPAEPYYFTLYKEVTDAELQTTVTAVTEHIPFNPDDADENGLIHKLITDDPLGIDIEMKYAADGKTPVGNSKDYAYFMLEDIPDSAVGYLNGNELQYTWATAPQEIRENEEVHWVDNGVLITRTRIDINVHVYFNEFTYNMEPTVTYFNNGTQLTEADFNNTDEIHYGGSRQLQVTKTIEGRSMLSSDNFEFELTAVGGAPLRRLAENADQTHNRFVDCDVLTAAANSENHGTALFRALQFLVEDLEGASSKTFTYRIHEVVPDEAFVMLQDDKLLYADADDDQKAAYDGYWYLDGITYAADSTINLLVQDSGNESLIVSVAP